MSPLKFFRRVLLWMAAGTALLMVGACTSENPKSSATAPASPAATHKPSTESARSAPEPGKGAAEAAAPADAGSVAAAGGVHACAGAGRWFPAEPDKLGKMVDDFLAGPAAPIGKPPVALIVPHAGYQFSGPVAGKAYAALRGRTYRRVVFLGPSHQVLLRGASVLRVDAYDTPLGRIPVDAAARDVLLKCAVVTEQPAAHRSEHSVENQLPMVQRTIGQFKMVELLVGEMTPAERDKLADAVRPLIDDATLIVASSDFTHYGPGYGYVPFRDRVEENLALLNRQAVQRIVQIDLPGWDADLERTHDTICGHAGIGLLLKVIEPWDDVRAARVGYDTSGHLTGDWTNSVTYASLALWREGGGLAKAEQETLLRLARDTVAAYLKTGKPPTPDPAKYDLTPAMKAPGAAFVTLTNKRQLRGCIGHIVAMEPLVNCVIDNAVEACRDPRFTDNPVTEKEVPSLTIEISVLAPLRRLYDLQTVQVGRDGLVMARGVRRGVFLPQVPIEQGWNREQYLAGLCQKSGLPLEALKDPQTEFHRFTAQVFGEEKGVGK